MGRGKSPKSLQLIDAAYEILATIQPATVRAVCYQLFNRKLIASMAKLQTDRVSKQLTWAREHGLIPWGWIVDEGRAAERVSAWENPAAYVEAVKQSYRRDRWTDQPDQVEVWSEKGTIRGTLAPVLEAYGVTFRVMHGYTSTTAAHDVAVQSQGNKPSIVFYVGDWDPSGLNMSEVDLPTRIERYGGAIEIVRVALTAEHCRELGTAPSFKAETKKKDSRYRWFVKHHGRRCWELDALSPVVLRTAVEAAITARLDVPAWNRAARVEAAECESLRSILDTWPGISRQAAE